MDSEKIAQTLVELRGARPRAEVATALGVSVSALAMYETGARIPAMKQSVKSRSITRKPWKRFFTLKNVTISDKRVSTLDTTPREGKPMTIQITGDAKRNRRPCTRNTRAADAYRK